MGQFKDLVRKQGEPYIPVLCLTCYQGWKWFPAPTTTWRTVCSWEVILSLAAPSDKKPSHPQAKGHLSRRDSDVASSYTVRPVLGSQGKAVGIEQQGRKQEGRDVCRKATDHGTEVQASSQREGEGLGARAEQKAPNYLSP